LLARIGEGPAAIGENHPKWKYCVTDISDGPDQPGALGAESPVLQRFELNGAPTRAEDLAALALLNYGHFTSMQIRDGRVRGLDLHLQRLERATRELFSSGLDTDQVRAWMRHIVKGEPGPRSLRVTVFSRTMRRERPAELSAIDVLTTSGPLRIVDAHPIRLRSFRYERALPHVKHVGTFGLFHHRRLAQLDGFDDALFVDSSDAISEASVWNIGFFDGTGIVWPDAPALVGVSMQLLDEGLRSHGIATSSLGITRTKMSAYRSAFLTNSSCAVRPVAAIDDVEFVVDDGLTRLLEKCYEANPWQTI